MAMYLPRPLADAARRVVDERVQRYAPPEPTMPSRYMPVPDASPRYPTVDPEPERGGFVESAPRGYRGLPEPGRYTTGAQQGGGLLSDLGKVTRRTFPDLTGKIEDTGGYVADRVRELPNTRINTEAGSRFINKFGGRGDYKPNIYDPLNVRGLVEASTTPTLTGGVIAEQASIPANLLPFGRGANVVQKVGVNILGSVAGQQLAGAVDKRLPEDMNPYARSGIVLGTGIVGFEGTTNPAGLLKASGKVVRTAGRVNALDDAATLARRAGPLDSSTRDVLPRTFRAPQSADEGAFVVPGEVWRATDADVPRGTRTLGQRPVEAAPVATPPVRPRKVGRGLKGAGEAARATGPLLSGEAAPEARIFPWKGRVADATETAPRIVTPPDTGDIIGLRPIEAGLSKGQQRMNAVRRTLGGIEENDISTPAMAERARVKPQIESQAKNFGMTAQAAVKSAFPDFDGVRVPSLEGIDPTIPGAPTIQDIAARYPLFRDVLTPPQRNAMDSLGGNAAKWKSLLDESGIEVGARKDVMEGGFYLPRGNADVEGVDAPVKVRAGGVGGTSAGFKKGAVFASQAEGISKGYEYSPLGEVLESYGRQAGNNALDAHLKQYFLAATKDGEAVFESAADRIDPELRGEVMSLRSRISGRAQTARNQGIRAGTQEGEAARAARVAGRAEGLAGNASERAQAARAARTVTRVTDTTGDVVSAKRVVEDTDGVLKAADRELRIREVEARKATARAGASEGRAQATNLRQQRTIEQLKADREEWGALNSRWQAAQKKAAETPRDQGRIGLPGMQGYTAADGVVNAANKILRNEGEMRGAGTIPLRAFSSLNNFQRGLRATGDNSFAMIQGLLGMGDDPQAYRRAMTAMVKAWGDENAAGKALNAFDERVAGTGRLTSSDWAKVLHYSGPDTEFAAGQGLPSRAKAAIQKAPIFKQSNRAFGTAGDVLRPEWADTLLEQEMKSTGKTAQQLWDDGTIAGIGRIVDRMTGNVPGSKVGNYTDAFLFAGRFMQSKLETLAAAGRGVVKGPIPGVATTIEERAARRAMLRMIALGTAMTIGANEARGEETDFRPIVGGRKNPNFMRIRAGGRDYSLFGTWDSLLGQMINLGAASVKVGQQDYAGGAQQVFGSLRGIASTPIALAWDLISGENGIGEETRATPQQTLGTIAESFTPFSSAETAGSLGTVVKGVATGDPQQAAQAVGEGLYAHLGGKSSPMTARERIESGPDYYSTLKGEAQFKAIPDQTWQTAMANVPAEERYGADKYRSIKDWRKAVEDSWTAAYVKQGYKETESRAEAESNFKRLPAYRYYLEVNDYYETEWYKANPAEGQKRYDAEMQKEDFDRRNLPTRKQREAAGLR